MNFATFPIGFIFAIAANAVAFAGPKPLDVDAASAEVASSYGKASPEVQEFVLHTVPPSVAAACGSTKMPIPI